MPYECMPHRTHTYVSLFLSAWRPLKTVKIAPLVVTDRRSVLRDDLIECHQVMPDRVVKNLYLKHRPYRQ
ncbi:uncharacterized protein BDR25DRAFT_299983 [Lindgomyces ingoldianus]|uniref:Uncharacterized protein n=1 Tax=Lindgomyces ingoldianus TaxID=673940 RepID=A0ACB6RE61_9PLEO|nr:uncharacterized protein BDR25DRAFT_299983 [Lindgomyces ingoldianus]KAF2476802.1 hypothetical protein BDR25DRAFT_299983 [Lindgomyces ingoldianus]